MLGSSASISGCNVVINTAVAESLRQYADILENAEDFELALHDLIKSIIKNHKRIIFNGNGYDEAWVREAEKRGLLNLPSTPDCVPCYLSEKNVELFTRHAVYSQVELKARHEMKLDTYKKVIHIEADTMASMVRKLYLPSVSRYEKFLADSMSSAKAQGIAKMPFEEETLASLSKLSEEAYGAMLKIESDLKVLDGDGANIELARFCRDRVLPDMAALRRAVDEMEKITSYEYWPVPSYGDVMFSVK